MYDEQFYYQSGADPSVVFEMSRKTGIFVDAHDIYEYEWEYESSYTSVSNFRRGHKPKKLPLRFLGDTQGEVNTKRNEAFRIFERDVRKGTPGKLHLSESLDGYYLPCYIYSSVPDRYIYERIIDTEWGVAPIDGFWHRIRKWSYYKVEQAESSGLDLPTDIPFDLGLNVQPKDVINNECIGSSSFKLVIWGAVSDPVVEIGGHTYKIIGSIESNERVEIQADKNRDIRTIKKIAADGHSVNWFGHRYKDESVFEEIPEGKVIISWDGSFGFDLYLDEIRSEPQWTYDHPKKEILPEYLLDSDGGIILDAELNPITAEG